ncbi:MAG: TetR/AcrR family transcriptional regulator, partial [Actinocrinis sp.]
GYAGMSTNQVAAEAGVSVGSLYRYFADKEEIFEELRVRAADGVFEELAAAVQAAAAMPVRPGVRHVVATLVDSIRSRAAVTSALINEVPLGSHSNVLPETERGLAQFTRMYAAQHAPELTAAELEARIYLAMGVTLSSCLRIALEKPEGLDAEHLIDMLADLLVLGLTAPAGG